MPAAKAVGRGQTPTPARQINGHQRVKRKWPRVKVTGRPCCTTSQSGPCLLHWNVPPGRRLQLPSAASPSQSGWMHGLVANVARSSPAMRLSRRDGSFTCTFGASRKLASSSAFNVDGLTTHVPSSLRPIPSSLPHGSLMLWSHTTLSADLKSCPKYIDPFL